MSAYSIPQIEAPTPAVPGEVLLIASGDLRQSANQVCWPAQSEAERAVIQAFAAEGLKVRRAHPYREDLKHGFIFNQRMGMDVFAAIDPAAPLVVVESVWQYSHHVLAGLLSHRGPILTVANWSGQWPGLVGMLNLNGCLRKAGVKFSTIWTKDFDDPFFLNGLRQWIREGKIDHDLSHVHPLDVSKLPASPSASSASLSPRPSRPAKPSSAYSTKAAWACSTPSSKTACSTPPASSRSASASPPSSPPCRTSLTTEARKVRAWLDKSGITFVTGPNEETDLTDAQVLQQCKMYIAALRIADDFGCDAIGIQYQQGLKDLVPASDLVEGLLNNVDRPPAFDAAGKELYAGRPLPHFNEVDECAGIDLILTNRIWTAMRLDPATTLHDVRWGEQYKDDFVWVFQISGAVPASHIAGGYAKASSERQPPMYFRLGGGTLKGVCKPGPVVWSRVFSQGGKLHADIGRATAIELPAAETERRLQAVTPQWPIMHVLLHGITRDQFMARHPANHVNVAYTETDEQADRALAAKAAMMAELGIEVHLCGTI